MADDVCPHCGHPLPPDKPYGLTPSGEIIFAAVKRAGRAGISRDRLEILLYGDELRHRAAVPNLVVQANKRLAPHGLRIAATRGRHPENRYTLQTLEYDAIDDINKSVAFCFAEIRKRKAAGGPGWKGHDPNYDTLAEREIDFGTRLDRLREDE